MLASLGLGEQGVGAEFSMRSGSAVSQAYQFKRRVTSIRLRKSHRGWSLIEVSRFDAHDKRADTGRLSLSVEQSDAALAKYKTRWSVMNRPLSGNESDSDE